MAHTDQAVERFNELAADLQHPELCGTSRSGTSASERIREQHTGSGYECHGLSTFRNSALGYPALAPCVHPHQAVFFVRRLRVADAGAGSAAELLPAASRVRTIESRRCIVVSPGDDGFGSHGNSTPKQPNRHSRASKTVLAAFCLHK